MTGRAARRARWLAELALALAQAGKVSAALAVAGSNNGEAKTVAAQIAALSSEIDRIRRGKPAFGEKDPKRM